MRLGVCPLRYLPRCSENDTCARSPERPNPFSSGVPPRLSAASPGACRRPPFPSTPRRAWGSSRRSRTACLGPRARALPGLSWAFLPPASARGMVTIPREPSVQWARVRSSRKSKGNAANLAAVSFATSRNFSRFLALGGGYARLQWLVPPLRVFAPSLLQGAWDKL